MVELPVTLVDRAGVNLADLSDEQRTAALRVLDALLSDEGYATVTGIMGGDEYLAGDGTEVQQIAASLDETYVNWSGASTYDMTQGDGVYFQISSPDVYIEFAAQQGSAGADVTTVSRRQAGDTSTRSTVTRLAITPAASPSRPPPEWVRAVPAAASLPSVQDLPGASPSRRNPDRHRPDDSGGSCSRSLLPPRDDIQRERCDETAEDPEHHRVVDPRPERR
ncbi:DUF3500 domain-containing protein [Gordonia terrae]|uniref:DUF3500 domain-containing protein n=1 Tax=Gordonia terrae TaxID=2055 RepID=UPI0026CBF74A|nr:DUF3500 domain-containing protein [Gordonia terrae]